jgi:hypothetical protein
VGSNPTLSAKTSKLECGAAGGPSGLPALSFSEQQIMGLRWIFILKTPSEPFSAVHHLEIDLAIQ